MLTPEQIKKIQAIDNPLIRQRYVKFYQLPEDLQDIIFSEETANKIWKIGKEDNQFSDDQLRWLAYFTGLVILGETPLNQFSQKIQEKCRLDETKAKNIIQEIAKEIFAPVKESLKKVQGLSSELEGLPAKSAGLPADLAARPSSKGISSAPAPTYQEPIEAPSSPQTNESKLPPSFTKVTEGRREISIPNVIDLKNLE